MDYRSLSDLSALIRSNLHKIPKDVELIVGIPRSGMIPASLIALYLNLPLADLEGFIAGRFLGGGDRTRSKSLSMKLIRNVLVVDDSICSGAALNRAKRDLLSVQGKNIRFGVVYLNPGMESEIDLYFEAVNLPRAFEWNLLYHKGILAHTCSEIDGVLTNLPPYAGKPHREEDYESSLRMAELTYRFCHPVGWIMTQRPERYRKITEKWLRENEIDYGELIMLGDVKDAKIRKHRLYGTNRSMFLFVEPSDRDAQSLANSVGKLVFSMRSREVKRPSDLAGRLRFSRNSTVRRCGKIIKDVLKVHSG
jgi:uncharacterized HAD superfamily protein/hypoxanthine phosphoribosyltransferase